MDSAKKYKLKIKKLQETARKLYKLAVFSRYGYFCEVCGKPAEHPHHILQQGLYVNLKYVVENGTPLCSYCHFSKHHEGNQFIHDKIIIKRGIKWWEDLKESQKETKVVHKDVNYYEGVMERLEKIINK